MDDFLQLALTQQFVTTRQARQHGVPASALSSMVRAGTLTRAMRGVYLPPAPHTPETRHAILTRAVLMDDLTAWASHGSALALHGVALYGLPTLPMHIADARAASRRSEGIHRHVWRSGDPLVTLDGWRALKPSLACLQVAARHGVRSGTVAMDSALHQGLTTLDELIHELERGRLRRGLVAARDAVAAADGRAESPGETLLRLTVGTLPFPYDLQVEIGGPGGYRVDILVAGTVALEFDGDVKYAAATDGTTLIAEKRREDRLRAAGLEVLRITWPQLGQPAALRQLIQAALLRARLRHAA